MAFLPALKASNRVPAPQWQIINSEFDTSSAILWVYLKARRFIPLNDSGNFGSDPLEMIMINTRHIGLQYLYNY